MVSQVVTLSGDRWRIGATRFERPVEMIVAHSLGDVVPALDAADRASRSGRWVVGFVSYQAAPGLDPALRVPSSDEQGLPLVWFGVYDDRGAVEAPSGSATLSDWEAGLSREEHAGRVESIRSSIVEGDTYQVNLTFPMEAKSTGSAEALFATMLGAQPDSYGALIDLGIAQVVSVSPELFLRVEAGTVTTMPMKGTAPRGLSTGDDLAVRDALVESEKERAGNMMIVDMVRNDLGRVARTGSVTVPALFDVERHPTVWQLTSTITADLDDGVGLSDLFRAVFPCGSVTGAPKVSTMRIIADLEPTPRGVYCGSIGYLAPGGDLAEFSVAIRTGVLEGDRFT